MSDKKAVKTMECDIAILGAGGSGIVAAARAASLSNNKIIVVEKAHYTGGGAAMAGDFRIYGSQWQKDHSLSDSLNSDLLKVMDMTYWKLDRQLVLRTFLATGQFFDWACTLADNVAAHFAPGHYGMDSPGNGPTVPTYAGLRGSTSAASRPGEGIAAGGKSASAEPGDTGAPLSPMGVRNGTYLTRLMATECRKKNVQVLLKHKVVDVEVTGGKIAAVIVESEQGLIRITCRACILATGSWINNRKYLEMASPVYAKLDPGPLIPSGHRNIHYTGDGIALAEKAGAFVDYDSFCIRPMGPHPRGPSQKRGIPMSGSRTVEAIRLQAKVLEINKEGKRYTCEPSAIRLGFFDAAHVALQQPDGITFVVFSRNILDAAVRESRENHSKEHRGFHPSLPDDIDADLASDDSVHQADTIEELAVKMGVPPVALKTSIEKYNVSCTAGFDDDCFKPKENLMPLESGPYYAAEMEIQTDGAFGGVLVNADMQAYKKGGGLVEGLYVTGDFASGRFINDLGVKRQIINDLAWAFASGYLAAESAVNYLSGKPV